MQCCTGAPPRPSKWSASGHILHRCFVFCHPGGRRGNTEQVVARWWHLVALTKALDLRHWTMHAVLHHRTTIAIKMASNGGTSFVVAASFVWSNIAKWPCYGPFKLALSYYIYLIGVIICLCVSLLAAAADNRCHFGHHSCRRECPISINHRGQ